MFTIDAKELRDVFAVATSFAGRRSPVRDDQFVQLADNRIVALDCRDHGMSYPIGRPNGGQRTLLPKSVAQSLKAVKGDVKLGVGCGQIQLNDFSWPVDKPTRHEFEPTVGLTLLASGDVDFAEFRRSLLAVERSTNSSSSRFALGAILVERDGPDGARLVATDGRRLTSTFFEGLGWIPAGVQLLIPSDWARKLAKVKELPGAVGVLEIYAPSRIVDGETVLDVASTIVLRLPCGMTLWTRLAEGRFPKWRDVVPSDQPYSMRFVAKELLEAIKTASIGLTKDERAIELKISGMGGAQIIGPTTAVKVDPDHVGNWADGITIKLDAWFLRDALEAFTSNKTDRVVIHWTAADKPIKVRPVLHDTFTIIMPMSRN